MILLSPGVLQRGQTLLSFGGGEPDRGKMDLDFLLLLGLSPSFSLSLHIYIPFIFSYFILLCIYNKFILKFVFPKRLARARE